MKANAEQVKVVARDHRNTGKLALTAALNYK